MSHKIERFFTPPSFDEVGCANGKGPIEIPDINSSRKEIWLIKTPANFDGKKLNGVALDLEGGSVEFTGPKDQDGKIYEAVGGQCPRDIETKLPYLLVPSEDGKTFEPAPELKGQITILESVSMTSSNPMPDIVTSHAPEMPQGLVQRFKPFGWEEPKNVSKQITCLSTSDVRDTEQDATRESYKQRTDLSKKLKRKHERNASGEVSNELQTAATESDSVPIPKKKKKKKKSHE